MVQKGEMGGKVPLMILNQTQPFPVAQARAAQHSPYMVMVFCMKGKPGLMDQDCVVTPLC